MVEFLVQSNYLRQVQRTFGGSADIDFLGMLVQVFLVAAPVAAVVLLWKYRHVILFTAGRLLGLVLWGKRNRTIENYLVSKGVLIDICLYTSEGVGRKLCSARIRSVARGKMNLELVDVSPVALKLKNARVICFVKPFSFSGKRVNSFVTIISHMKRRGVVIKSMTLYAPARYRFTIRRRHARQRTREGSVRVKAWSGRKVGTFWMTRPDVQTVNNPTRMDGAMRLQVENISAGGMRMFVVNPGKGLPALQPGNQLILRVSIWNPKVKKYMYFTALGTIRSRFAGRKGAVGLGIQFTSEGEKIGSRYTWHTVKDEIQTLAKFLAQLEE